MQTSHSRQRHNSQADEQNYDVIMEGWKHPPKDILRPVLTGFLWLCFRSVLAFKTTLGQVLVGFVSRMNKY